MFVTYGLCSELTCQSACVGGSVTLVMKEAVRVMWLHPERSVIIHTSLIQEVRWWRRRKAASDERALKAAAVLGFLRFLFWHGGVLS